MNHVVIGLWALLSLIIGLLTIIAVWSRYKTKARAMAIFGFLLAIPATGGALFYALGWPVPYVVLTALQIRGGGDFGVLGAKMVVGEGIFALLDFGATPRYVVLPWDKNMASKLQELMESQREGETGEPRLKLPPMEWSLERRKPPEIYALPQPKILPPKPSQEAPLRFDNI